MEELSNSKIVSVDSIDSEKVSPILVTFQNAGLSSEDCKKAFCKRVQTESDGRKYALIATDTNTYKADITDDSEYADTYLAVHNKETREIRLIQVKKASFKHVLYDNTRSIYEQNVVDSKKILSKEFGGKKASIAFDRNQKTQINSKILEDTVDKNLDSIDTETIFAAKEENSEDSLSPSIFPEIKGDTKGKSVREIFSTASLLGGCIDQLHEKAFEILTTDIKDWKFTSEFLKKSAAEVQLKKTPDSLESQNKVSILIYADILVKLINFRKKMFEPSSELSNFPHKLREDIMKKFFVQNSKTYSHFTRQKSIVFYIILALLSTEFLQVDFNDILCGVHLSKRELLKYATVIGCTTKGDTLLLSKVNSSFDVPLVRGKKNKR